MSLILVIGPHRSGTSAVTRLINLMGAEVGSADELVGASEENPKGFWERADVITANDQLLASLGAAWNKVGAWNPAAVKPEVKAAFLGEMRRILEKFPKGRPVVLKDPRLCLSLGLMLEAYPDSVCVFTYREPQEVAMSLNRRNQIPLEGGMAIWEAYSFHALAAAKGKSKIFISYHDLLAGKWAETEKLFNGLQAAGVNGLQLPAKAAAEDFVDEKLHRSLVDVKLPVDAVLLAAAKGEGEAPTALSGGTRHVLSILDWAVDLQAEKDALELKLQEIAGALHVEGATDAVLKQIQFMHELVLERDQKLQEFNKYLVQFRENAARLQEQFSMLNRLVDETMHSRSWKLGNALMRMAAKVTGRSAENNSLAQAKQLLDGAAPKL